MTVRQILTYPHLALRETAKPVEDVKAADIVQLIADLRDTLKAYKAQGLAASQIGSFKRIVIVSDGEINRILINPEILSKEDEVVAAEGCLSFPGVSARIMRSKNIEVAYLDEDGHAHKWSPEGLGAVAIQHELDHLDGILMIDYMTNMEKKIAKRRVKKVKKRLGSYAV